MATGRFLSSTISTDKQLALLSLEAEWLYLHSIPHLDRDGMIGADPIELLLQIAPLRFSALAPRVAALVDEWIAVGLVIRFATPQGGALFFKGFLKNQTLRYDRERPSLYPPPPGYIHTANGLRPATDVPWVHETDEQPSAATPGYYPKNPAETPVLPEFHPSGENAPAPVANGSSAATPGYYPKNPAEMAVSPDSQPQAAEKAESAAPKQIDTGKQQQAAAAAAGLFSECRLLLVEFGISEPSLGRILAKNQPPDHVRGWLVEAIRASQRPRRPISDPVAFAVARLLAGDPPPRLVSAQEYDEFSVPDDADADYEALKRRYIPAGLEDIIKH